MFARVSLAFQKHATQGNSHYHWVGQESAYAVVPFSIRSKEKKEEEEEEEEEEARLVMASLVLSPNKK